VKKIGLSDTAAKDFDREIQNLMRVSHQNIVRFLGYCDTTEVTYMNTAKPGEAEKLSSVCNQERIICFEYISNGSLTRHINGMYTTCSRSYKKTLLFLYVLSV
jgi:coatomer subunit beta'